mgnify:CR=1 FL=1
MQRHNTTGTASGGGPDAPAPEEHITLAQAAKLAPGRPSANCVWRWCREGVKATSGQWVRLKHVRFWARIYTTRQWMNAFWLALAKAGAAHSDRDEQAPPSPEPARRGGRPSGRVVRRNRASNGRRLSDGAPPRSGGVSGGYSVTRRVTVVTS